MLTFPNNTILIQSLSELPRIKDREIVLDFETTSGNPKISSTNPWHNCSLLGVCICDSTDSPGYYIPVGHHNPTPNEPNLPLPAVAEWLSDVLSHCEVLVGQNIKYDAHVLRNCLGIEFTGILYDTLTQAKIVDSDRLSYSLDSLSKDWLGADISQYELAFAPYLYDGRGNKVNQDYGAIPAIIMAPYGGQDVLTTRRLKRFCEEKRPAQCNIVSQNEIALTSVLLDIERTGLRVDPTKVVLKQVETNWRLVEIIYRIRELTGCEIRPNTTDDCHRFLCGQYGLPILKWTNEEDDSKQSNPCFDKYAMKSYLLHPKVKEDAILFECVNLIREYRTLDTFNSLFLNTFDNRNISGILHSTYNQCVRTARLSCSDPNAQQMSDLAKGLIEVDTSGEWVLVDLDLSQIEFRLIASALNNQTVIDRYNNDPSTDYHSFVAELAGIDRGPAKNLNFAVGFAAGRKKAIQMVKGSLDITSVGFKESGMHFDAYCQMRAESMYDSYHRMLPELKPTIRQAEKISKKYGYISNLYGRHRRLPYGASYKAFNAYIQSSAADLAKSLTLQITELLCNTADWRELVKLVAVVHDSWIFYMHRSVYIQVCNEITSLITRVKPPGLIRVPIRSSCKVSRTNWNDALLTLSPQVIY